MDFKDIIGNDEIKNYLLNCTKTNKILQSYLFVGTEGIGKLMTAKIFAKKILCLNKENNCKCKSCGCFDENNHPDFEIINENGDTIKIEQIRQITNKVIEQPIISNKKVYIINDCEKMTTEAQNCLLKTLEEPPEFVVIILISSNENNILNTIKSRCMTIKFKNIPNDKLQKYIIDKLGNTQMTENLINSFNGSIGKAVIQIENQEDFLKIDKLIDKFQNADIIDIINYAKFVYDKEKIYSILEYMLICLCEKSKQNKEYINCIDIINEAKNCLLKNCNLDMTIDKMLFEMYNSIRKGI